MFSNRTMSDFESILWIIIGIIVLLVIIYRNNKLTKILIEIDSLIEDSKKKCKSNFDNFLDADENTKEKFIDEFEKEAQKFVNIRKNKKRSKGQEGKLDKHISYIYSYIEIAKNASNYYEIDEDYN